MNTKNSLVCFLSSCIIPILLFTLIAFAIPYFIKCINVPMEYNKDTAWGRIFFMNDKISYVPIDSIEYLSYQDKELFKNQGQHFGADITNLFKDYHARKITVISDLHNKYTLQIWYPNKSVLFLNGLIYKNGQWIGNINSGDSTYSAQKINLGRVEGFGYSIREQKLDLPQTYFNVFLILTICILASCVFISYSNCKNNSWWTWTILALLCVAIGMLIDSILNGYRVSETFIIEVIIALFCVCEFVTISTFYVLPQMKAKSENKENIKI